MVPRLSITSSSLMPMPLSLTVNVPAVAVRYQCHGQRVRAQQAGIGKRLEAQFLAGIRGVRYQLAQEDLLVRIQRMDHQSQYLLGLGLELFDLWLCFGRHGLTIVIGGSIQRAAPCRPKWGRPLRLQARPARSGVRNTNTTWQKAVRSWPFGRRWPAT